MPFVNCTVYENPPNGPAPGTPVCTVTGASRNSPIKLTYALNAAGASLNLPFPFAITTLNNSNPNDIQSAAITTISAGASTILYSGGFKVFYGTITVTDQYGLTGSGPIEMWVLWVQQPPYFNTATRAPGTATFALSVPQHTPLGTLISRTPLLGYSKDPWQVPFLRYTWDPSTPAAATGNFSVDPAGANVTIALSKWTARRGVEN